MSRGKYRTSGVSVYQRANRPNFYISYVDPLRPDRERIHEATPFRTDDPEGRRKANALAMEKARDIRLAGDSASHERWEAWVSAYLEEQYKDSPLTLPRRQNHWRWLSLFLIHEKQVRVPRALTYQHMREYHQWRTRYVKAGGRRVSAHTACIDITTMSVIMNEAVARGYAPSNPCLRLNLKPGKVRHARELLPHELALIEEKLPDYVAKAPETREWMPIAYQIARYQGCRLRETRINLKRHVDLRTGTLTLFVKGRKGGDGETTQLHPKLRPLFEKLLAEGKQWTLDYGQWPSMDWRYFLDSIGLHDAWFHCLRSTVITEMARAGVPISQAMRYVLHANEEIHRAYQRLQPGDLSGVAKAIGGVEEAVKEVAKPGDEQLKAAVIAELVRGGMGIAEAVAKVMGK